MPKIGFDFSHAMRAFLRADPDVIMVGEMRDYETAKIGVEASLTGHLVLSTLHTNSAPETIVRLLDMGIDPVNFADSLLGRPCPAPYSRLCPKCKEAYKPTDMEMRRNSESYGKDMYSPNWHEGWVLPLSGRWAATNATIPAIKGRMGMHELLVVSDRIKKLIAKREGAEVSGKLGSRRDEDPAPGRHLESLCGHTDLKQVLSVCMR